MITKTGAALLDGKFFDGKFRGMEKTAVTSWRGALSGLSSIARKRLKPFAKSLDDELAGINEGTRNIAERAGYEITPATDYDDLNAVINGGGFITDHKKKKIFYIPQNKIRNKNQSFYTILGLNKNNLPIYKDTRKSSLASVEAHALRHEANEALEFMKGINKNKQLKYKILSSQNLDKPYIVGSKNSPRNIAIRKEIALNDLAYERLPNGQKDLYNLAILGDHVSPNVLSKETRLINQSFHSGRRVEALKNIRRRNGEAEILGRNAGLNPRQGSIYDRFLTNRDYKNMAKSESTLFEKIDNSPKNSDMPMITRYDFRTTLK